VLAGALLAPSIGLAQNAAYDAVVKGMTCKQQTAGRMDCVYTVDDGLRFTIAGVGQADVVVNFTRVDSASAFVPGMAPLNGCVIVKPAQTRPDSLANMAFVSPHDGKVYRNWSTCLRQAPKR
jgi:hypothetical protein